VPAQAAAPGSADDTPIQQPVLPSFVWGAFYGFLVRTVCCLLSLGLIAPVNGPLTALVHAGNATLGGLLLLAEFFLLGLAAVAAVVVGAGTQKGGRPALVRALFFGRVFFWATCWYLATIVIAAFYVIGWETVGGGIWILLLGCLNIPLLFMSRKIINRTRWVATHPA
jgi:hypothetical protein